MKAKTLTLDGHRITHHQHVDFKPIFPQATYPQNSLQNSTRYTADYEDFKLTLESQKPIEQHGNRVKTTDEL